MLGHSTMILLSWRLEGSHLSSTHRDDSISHGHFEFFLEVGDLFCVKTERFSSLSGDSVSALSGKETRL